MELKYCTNIFSNLDLNLKILLLYYLHFLSSIYLVCEHSCKFNEALILQPIFSNLYLRYIILKDWCQIRYIDWWTKFQVNTTSFRTNLSKFRLSIKYCKISMLDLHSTPSKFLECKFSSKPGKVLNLEPICLKIEFGYNILKCQKRQTPIQHL